MVCNKILELMKGTTLFIPPAWSVQNVINSTTLKLSFISIKIYAKRQLTAGHISSPPHRHTMQLIPLYSQHIFLVYPGAYPWGKLMRYVLRSMKIYEAVGDPQEGPAPPIFRPKWGLKGCENVFGRPLTLPYLRVWMTAPHLISRSTSSTLSFKGNLCCKCLTSNVCTPFNNKPFNFKLAIFRFSSNYRLLNKAPFQNIYKKVTNRRKTHV